MKHMKWLWNNSNFRAKSFAHLLITICITSRANQTRQLTQCIETKIVVLRLSDIVAVIKQLVMLS